MAYFGKAYSASLHSLMATSRDLRGTDWSTHYNSLAGIDCTRSGTMSHSGRTSFFPKNLDLTTFLLSTIRNYLALRGT